MKKLIFIIATLVLSTVLSVVSTSNQASALSGSEFNPGRIIDDAVFYNSNSMSTAQIQTFLNSKVPTCDTQGQRLAPDWGYPTLTRAQVAEKARTTGIMLNGKITVDPGFHAPPYTCLRDYRADTPQIAGASGLCEAIPAAQNQTSAQMIYNVAKACGINPQVFLVLLEKEQSLLTDTWPLARQFNSATGFACPDTADCNPAFKGLFQQIYNAGKQFKIYQAYPTHPDFNYRAGRTQRIYFQTNLGNFINPTGNANDPSRAGQSACGYQNIYIENQATAALYIYTPYQPNQAALNNLRGTGDACSAYGNRNFWRLFNDWFGSTIGYVYNGANYSAGFDPVFYSSNNPDVKAAFGEDYMLMFYHFMVNGLREGRQATADFNLTSYMTRYPDLRAAFGNDLHQYLWHYIVAGKSEGRVAV